MCGAAHMAKDKTPAECTRMCVKDGMKLALAGDRKLRPGGTRAGTCETGRPKSLGQGNSEERQAVRSASRRGEITIGFALTLEWVPEFKLFL